MIPKIIHYCWFGEKPLPINLKVYIDGWRSKLSDFEIREWNESNFDVNVSLFSKQAFENKKWAFVSDYVRLFVLYKYGGVYLDTDMEIINDISPFLNYQMLLGYEASGYLQAGLIGAEKECKYIEILLDYYNNHEFINENGIFDTEPIGKKIEKVLKKYFYFEAKKEPFLLDNNILVCPSRYFCPDLITEVNSFNNYAIHHGEGSWLSTSQKIKQKIFLLITRNKILSKVYKHIKRR